MVVGATDPVNVVTELVVCDPVAVVPGGVLDSVAVVSGGVLDPGPVVPGDVVDVAVKRKGGISRLCGN